MTFREKLAQEHPEKVSTAALGGCEGCPITYGYEDTSPEDGCWDTWNTPLHKNARCTACWDREIPEERPMTQEEQEQHDREINAEIILGYCQQYGGCIDCPADEICTGLWDRSGKDSIKNQLAVLQAFKDALPHESAFLGCYSCKWDDTPCDACDGYSNWTPRGGRPPQEQAQKPVNASEAWDDPDSGEYRHKKIAEELTALYVRKNADYGDSFHRSFVDWGMPMAAIRLGDKYNRFVSLVKNKGETQVKDESLRDTLIDLANYAIMTVMELDEESKGAF